MGTMTVCKVCGADAADVRLHPCPICHTRVCGTDAYRRGGKQFCSRTCAEEFFKGEDPDAPEGHEYDDE